jgi:16S rRNA (guanine527-N7)-methyltransferase
MPPAQRFDVITLRAVDNMQAALAGATPRLAAAGTLAVLTTEGQRAAVAKETPGILWAKPIAIPQSEQRILLLGKPSK